MEYKQQLMEMKLGKDIKIEEYFNKALGEVFSPTYLTKVNDKIKNKIKVKERVSGNQSIVAWVVGTTIYVNRPVFERKSLVKKIRYLLHEFFHVLNNSKSFFIISKFPEINTVSKQLWEIVIKDAENVGLFLIGIKADKKKFNNQEALSYLMNNDINWNQLPASSKAKFIKTLENSNLFNLKSSTWKSILR